MYKSIILFLLFYNPLCLAIILEPQEQSETMVWIESFRLKTPAMDTDRRFGPSLSYKHDWCLHRSEPFCIGVMAKLNSLQDPHQKASSLDVRQDFYHLFLPLKISYTKFLRFSLLAGPGYVKSYTEFMFSNQSTKLENDSWLAYYGLMIDYAITTNWRFSWHLSSFRRVDQKKDHRVQGVGVGLQL